MRQYLNKAFLLSHKEIVIKAAVIICIIMVAFFVFVSEEENGEYAEDVVVQSTETKAESREETQTPVSIIVDVGGAVKTPQVVELKENSRVADAISAAGGLTEQADTAGINQAAFLTDGEKVYIPEKGESGTIISGITSAVGSEVTQQKININTATSEELQTLDGIGPVTAEKILTYRDRNGAFQNIEDLKNVDGIGDKTFENLKEHITI